MSDPYTLSDNGTQAMANDFLFDDWDMTDKSPTDSLPPFDGKIIARMPDFGSNGFAKNIEKPRKLPPLWNRAYRTCLSFVPGAQRKAPDRSLMGTRQQFFQRVTAFGGALLLGGIILLLLDQNSKKPEPFNIVNILPVNQETVVTQTDILAQDAPPTVPPPKGSNVPSPPPASTAALVADKVAAAQKPVAGSPEQAEEVWNRRDSASPWDVAPKQPKDSPPSSNPPSSNNVAGVAPPPATVAMTPMTPMTPTTPMPASMPVSPFERQLVAQAPPPERPPVDPFIQASQPQVQPGMMPMHERLESMINAHPQEAHRSASAASPYHLPPYAAAQGGGGVPASPPQGSYGQHGPVPRNAAAPSSNMPIPSGVSALSPQPPQGYYQQNPAGNFHPNPQPYHRVY